MLWMEWIFGFTDHVLLPWNWSSTKAFKHKTNPAFLSTIFLIFLLLFFFPLVDQRNYYLLYNTVLVSLSFSKPNKLGAYWLKICSVTIPPIKVVQSRCLTQITIKIVFKRETLDFPFISSNCLLLVCLFFFSLFFFCVSIS